MTTSQLLRGISAVIPVHRAEKTLPLLLPRLTAALEAIGPAHEIILVDDGSPDGSWPVIGDSPRWLRAEGKVAEVVADAKRYGDIGS